uniref:probable glutamyl endopeptidase, chloroplastic n=1 Tax=Erigeron canadensis TaxID=72917 RepID=UPI001CB9B668|nr:probable glutamyl endopeptidase, chloroplastic [Erigeron canadensis]
MSSSSDKNPTYIKFMSDSGLHIVLPINAIASEDTAAPNDSSLSPEYGTPAPVISISPKKDKILVLKRTSLPPLSEALAKQVEKLTGIRIDGKSNARNSMSFCTGIGIHDLKDDGTWGPEKLIDGFPEGSELRFVTWSKDAKHVSFSIRQDQGDDSKLRVWVADVETGKARLLCQSQDVFVNEVYENYVWVNSSTLLVRTIPESRGSLPEKPLVPSKDEYNEDLFEYHATSQLALVSLDGTVKFFGEPAIYTSLDPSADGEHILVSSIHRPFSFTVPSGRFSKKVDLCSADGKFLRTLCYLPLAAKDLPIASESVQKSMHCGADKSSALYWWETQDGGDAKVEVSPRDILPLLGLARRFAILPEPTIPIIGEGKEEPDDSYVQQLEAAVEEVIRLGIAHPDKFAIGGRSYGAFMNANLLAHAPHLFSCGIAQSGAYNQTLTPFGFQVAHPDKIAIGGRSYGAFMNENLLAHAPRLFSCGIALSGAYNQTLTPFGFKKEDRLLWEATDTYINNTGTVTMQADHFFNALKGHGALTRFAVLPFISHDYSSRENIMHLSFGREISGCRNFVCQTLPRPTQKMLSLKCPRTKLLLLKLIQSCV